MNKLRELREKKGVSQRDVAKFMNLTQAAYWSLEKGRSLLNSEQLMNLSIYFGCTPNDILDFKTFYQSVLNELHDVKK